MKRIVKDPDVRRLEIITAAEKLFKMLGYEKTPVELIIKEAGIAKGTFYYYFKSKRDILQAIVEKNSADLAEYFSAIVENKRLTAIQKFKRMLKSPKKEELVTSPVMEMLHQSENRELQEQLNIESIHTIAPLMHKVLLQGYAEGVFKRQASLESMQLILAGSTFLLDSGLFAWPEKKRKAFLKCIQIWLEELVGAKPGILHFIANKE